MIKIPKRRKLASKKGPNHILLYGLPKSGKTTICSFLPKSLIVELENGGADFVESISLQPKDLIELKEISQQLNPEYQRQLGEATDAKRISIGLPARSKEEIEYESISNNFKFVIIDTITVLEEFAKPLANSLFRQTPAGAAFSPDSDITTAAKGAGWGFLRTALLQIMDWFTIKGIRLLMIGHVKDKNVSTAAGDVSIKEIALAGQTGQIIASKCDGIGYVVRDEEDSNKLYIDFSASTGVISGCRISHLANRRILISEMVEYDEFGKVVEKDENNKYVSPGVSRGIVTHWNEIYPDIEELTKMEENELLRLDELEPIVEEQKKKLHDMVEEIKAKKQK